MRIVFTSDLHYDYSEINRKITEQIIKEMEILKPDIIVIAGDVAEKISVLDHVLSLFSHLSATKLFVPGNHDIWVEDPPYDNSFKKYKYFIPKVCRNNNFINLTDSIYTKNNIALIGSIGWYDYTFKRDYLEYSDLDYDKGDFEEGVNYDCNKINWIEDNSIKLKNSSINKHIFDYMFKEFDEFLLRLPEQFNKIVIVLHMVPFSESLKIYDEVPLNPLIAYEGSVRIGKRIFEISNQKDIYVIHGHSHDNFISLEKRNIKIRCNPLGEYDGIDNTNIVNTAKRSIGIIDI